MTNQFTSDASAATFAQSAGAAGTLSAFATPEPLWRQLGYPSEEEWVAAGMPQVPYEPPPMTAGAEALGGLEGPASEPSRGFLGDALDFVGDLPIGPVVNSFIPGGGVINQAVESIIGRPATVEDAYNVYQTDIPVYSDFARSTIQPALRTAGEGIARSIPGVPLIDTALDALGSPVNVQEAGGFLGEAIAPVSLGDVAVESIPGVGMFPDFARVMRRGGQGLVDNLGRSIYESLEDPEVFRAVTGSPAAVAGGGDQLEYMKRVLDEAGWNSGGKPADIRKRFEDYMQLQQGTVTPRQAARESYGETLEASGDPGAALTDARRAAFSQARPAQTEDEIMQAFRDTEAALRASRNPVDDAAELARFETERYGAPVMDDSFGLGQAVEFGRRQADEILAMSDKELDTALRDVGVEPGVMTRADKQRALSRAISGSFTQPTFGGSVQAPPSAAVPPPASPPPRPSSSGTPPKPPKPSAPDRFESAGVPWAPVENFINQRLNLLRTKSADSNPLRAVTATLTGNIQSPYLDEVIQSEKNIADQIDRLLPNRGANMDKAEIDKLVSAAQKELRERALAQKYTGEALEEAKKVLERNTFDRLAAQTFMNGIGYTEANNIWRTLMLGLDIAGITFQQGARALRGSPAIISGLLARGVGPVRRGLYFGPDDVSFADQALADGLQLLVDAKSADVQRTLLNRIPIIGPAIDFAQRAQFEQGMGAIRLRAYEGLLLMNKALGVDITSPVVRRRIAEAANTIGSTSMTATGARREAIEQGLQLSARMTRAQFNEVAMLLKAPRSTTDLINAMNLIAGTGLVFWSAQKLNEYIGADDQLMFDPRNFMFGRMVLDAENSKGEKIVHDFLPQSTLFRTIMKSYASAEQEEWENLAQGWLKFGMGRLGPIPDLVTRNVFGHGYGRGGQFYTGDMPLEERLIGSAPIPLAIRGSLIEGETDMLSLGLGQTGANSFGERASHELDRQFREQNPNGVVETYGFQTFEEFRQVFPGDARKWKEENQKLFDKVNEQKEGKSARDQELIDEYLTSQQARDEEIFPVDPVQWRELSNSFSRALGNTRHGLWLDAGLDNKEPPEDRPLDWVNYQYHSVIEENTNPRTKVVDWDKVDRWVASLDDYQRDLLFQSGLEHETPLRRQYLTDLQELIPYWDIRDEEWREWAKNSPMYSQYNTLDEAILARVNEFVASGYSRAEANAIVNGMFDEISQRMSDRSFRYALDHKEIIPLLDRYGYYVPADLRPLARPIP